MVVHSTVRSLPLYLLYLYLSIYFSPISSFPLFFSPFLSFALRLHLRLYVIISCICLPQSLTLADVRLLLISSGSLKVAGPLRKKEWGLCKKPTPSPPSIYSILSKQKIGLTLWVWQFESWCFLLRCAQGAVILPPCGLFASIISTRPCLLSSINLSSRILLCHLLNFYSLSHTEIHKITLSLSCLLTVQFTKSRVKLNLKNFSHIWRGGGKQNTSLFSFYSGGGWVVLKNLKSSIP